MRREQLTTRVCAVLTAAAILLGLVPTEVALAADANIKVEAILVWGTNDSKSPNPRHKPVDEDVQKKLKELPLKWTHYFEENRRQMELPAGQAKREGLSDRCAVEVKNLGQSKAEISLIGKGEPVVKRMQDLPKGETLVLGGNAPNATAWLVVLKRVE
jgi:hypothetical protein